MTAAPPAIWVCSMCFCCSFNMSLRSHCGIASSTVTAFALCLEKLSNSTDLPSSTIISIFPRWLFEKACAQYDIMQTWAETRKPWSLFLAFSTCHARPKDLAFESRGGIKIEIFLPNGSGKLSFRIPKLGTLKSLTFQSL